MKRKRRQAICPCCQGEVALYDCTILDKAYQGLFAGETLEKMWPKVPGACDHCLRGRKAILANPKAQVYNSLWDMPFLTFWDKSANCEDCQTEFSFSKEEQKFWFEELKFQYSFPKHCPSCRRQRREKIAQNNRLMELLKQDFSKDENLMREIAEIYAKMGNEDKSQLFFKRAEKLSAKKNKSA